LPPRAAGEQGAPPAGGGLNKPTRPPFGGGVTLSVPSGQLPQRDASGTRYCGIGRQAAQALRGTGVKRSRHGRGFLHFPPGGLGDKPEPPELAGGFAPRTPLNRPPQRKPTSARPVAVNRNSQHQTNRVYNRPSYGGFPLLRPRGGLRPPHPLGWWSSERDTPRDLKSVAVPHRVCHPPSPRCVPPHCITRSRASTAVPAV
jgi:hypothetical protein